MREIVDAAFVCQPVRVIAADNIEVLTKDFEAWSLPERVVTPIHVPQGRMNVGAGVIFGEDKNAVEVTRYLQKRAAIDFPEPISPNAPSLEGVRPLIIFNAGWRNYYHSLIQGMFSAWIFREYLDIPNGKFVHPEPLPKLRHLLDAAGLNRDNCVFMHKNLNTMMHGAVLLPTTYDAYAYRPLKLLAHFGEFLRAKLCGERAVTHDLAKKVYISRRDSNNRCMLNEEELEKMLQQKGYRVVRLSDHTLEEQANIFFHAEKIIAPHGAGLSNLIFSRAGTEILELTGNSYINPCFSKIGQVLDLNYTVIVSETIDSSRAHLQMTWRVNLDVVMAYA